MPAETSAAAVPHADVYALLAEIRTTLSGIADPPELLDLAATMQFTAQSRSSIYRGIAAGDFPQSVDTPSGKRWRRKDLTKWVERLK